MYPFAAVVVVVDKRLHADDVDADDVDDDDETPVSSKKMSSFAIFNTGPETRAKKKRLTRVVDTVADDDGVVNEQLETTLVWFWSITVPTATPTSPLPLPLPLPPPQPPGPGLS